MMRAFLAGIALALATVAQAAPITVDGGAIEGSETPSGVAAWYGVPFAAPPLRDLRWKAPQPVQPWQGVLHTDRFAPECLQPLRGSLQNHDFGGPLHILIVPASLHFMEAEALKMLAGAPEDAVICEK